MRKLGSPTKIERRKVPNQHQPMQIDEVVVLHYDGLAVSLYELPDKQFLTEVLVANPKLRVLYDLGVGSSASRITQILGNADEVSEGSLRYTTASRFGSVTFKFADGLIKSIDWTNRVD